MKKLLLLLAALGGVFAFLRRRGRGEESWQSTEWSAPTTSGAGEAPAPASQPEAQPSPTPDPSLTSAPASEMDPTRREEESRQTPETRFDRLAEAESEQRHELAEDVAEDLSREEPGSRTA